MNRRWYGAWAVLVYLFIAGCAKEARVNGRMIERQFSKPLASLRLAAETFAETGDATAFDAAKERIRQEGVVRAGLIEAGRQSMPAVAFMDVIQGEETQDSRDQTILTGSATLRDGTVLKVVSYYASVTNTTGKMVVYTLTVRRDSLKKS